MKLQSGSTCIVPRVHTGNDVEVLNLPKGNWNCVATTTLNFNEISGESFYGTLSNIIATISKSDSDVRDESSQVDSGTHPSAYVKLIQDNSSFDDFQPFAFELTNNDIQAIDDFLGFLALDDLIAFLATFPLVRNLPDREGGNLRSRNSQGRPALDNWYSHFDKRPTLLAVLLDPTGKHFDEYRRSNGNRERARL